MHEGAAAPSYLRPGLALRPCPSFGRPRVRGGESSILTPLVALKRSLNPPGRGFGSQTLFANLQPRKARPSKSAEPALRFKVGSPLGFQVGFADRDGKIEDFDAAPLERPKWPLPLSFFFSPRAAFHLPGVPALRSAKALSSGLQPRKRGLRPAVTEGDRKMMQLRKMKHSFS